MVQNVKSLAELDTQLNVEVSHKAASYASERHGYAKKNLEYLNNYSFFLNLFVVSGYLLYRILYFNNILTIKLYKRGIRWMKKGFKNLSLSMHQNNVPVFLSSFFENGSSSLKTSVILSLSLSLFRWWYIILPVYYLLNPITYLRSFSHLLLYPSLCYFFSRNVIFYR